MGFGKLFSILLYFDDLSDIQAKNHPAAVTNPAKSYIDKTGQNDFHIIKVARDRENIILYKFYAILQT